MNEHLIKAKRIGKNFNVVIEEQKYTKVVESEEGKQLMEVVKTYNEKLEKTKSDLTVKKLYKQFLKEVGFEDKKEEKEKKELEVKGEKKSIKRKIKEVINLISFDRKKLNKLPKDVFTIDENNNVYVTGFNHIVPNMLVDRFINFIDKKISIQPLLNFWYKCLLNPNDVARAKLFDYLMHHRIIITPHGNFVTYRMVKDHTRDGEKLPDGHYTDAHSYTMDYEIGKIYRLNRKTECDEDGSRDCSRGLHTGSPAFIGIELGDGYNKGEVKTKSQGGNYGTGYDHPTTTKFDSTFGNIAVICLVNPQHVVSIPNSNTRKMRSCEIYIAKLTTPEEVLNHLVDEDYNIFDDEYSAIQEKELKELLKDKKLIDYIKDSDNLTSKKLENLKKKLEDLTIHNDLINNKLSPQEVINIIKNRIVKLT
jgi:hypothetical protein